MAVLAVSTLREYSSVILQEVHRWVFLFSPQYFTSFWFHTSFYWRRVALYEAYTGIV